MASRSLRFIGPLSVTLAVVAAACGPGTETESTGSGASGGGGAGASGAAGGGGGAGATGGGNAGSGGTGGGEDLTVWPNSQSRANSDPWLAEHHDEIRELHPRVLALNFVNGRSNADMEALMGQIFAAMKEGSRYHGYKDPSAPAALHYEIGKSVDLTDSTPPDGWPYKNSTLYPRKPPDSTDYWKFDYKALFSEAFAAHYGIQSPDDPSHDMTLCELLEQGLIHEVWVYGDADVPDVNAAEVLENKPVYGPGGQKLPGQLDPCAGNGCYDAGDVPTCKVTARVLWVNNTRGPGCATHSLGHGIESTGGWSGANPLPMFRKSFRRFANLDLDQRHGTPFGSFYGVCSTPDCLSYPGPSTVDWKGADQSGTIDPFDPGCGNVHFPPNARAHYDDQNTDAVLSTCEHYGLGDSPSGGDEKELYTNEKSALYDSLSPDCGGGWLVYWYQSFPGYQNQAKDPDGQPIPSWWPFLYY